MTVILRQMTADRGLAHETWMIANKNTWKNKISKWFTPQGLISINKSYAKQQKLSQETAPGKFLVYAVA